MLRWAVCHEERVIRFVPMQTVGYAQAITHPMDASVRVEPEEHSHTFLRFEELWIVENTNPESTMSVTSAIVGAESGDSVSHPGRRLGGVTEDPTFGICPCHRQAKIWPGFPFGLKQGQNGQSLLLSLR